MDTFGRAMMILAMTALTLYTILFMRRCMRNRAVCGRPRTSTEKRRCADWVRRLFRFIGERDDDSIGRGARALATKLRLAYCKLIMQFFMHVAVVSLMYFAYFRHLDGVWDSNYEGQEPSSDPFLFCLFFMVAGMIVEVNSRVLTRRFIECYHIAFMALLTWKTVATPNVFLLTFRSRGMIPMRMCMGIWSGNTVLVAALNAAYTFASSWSYIGYSVGDEEAAEKFEPGHVVWYLFDDVLIAVSICFASYAIEWRGLAESRATVTGHLAKQAGATLNSLLTALCDVVVRLGPDFQVYSGTASLLALLLKTPASASSFPEFLQPTDRERFLEYAAATRDLDVCGAAPSLHVGMRDANGTLVQTQFFMASFPDLDNQYEYLLGIRELSREENETAIPVQLPGESSSLHALCIPRALRSEGSCTESIAHLGSDISSNTSYGSYPWNPHSFADNFGELSFVFNVMSELILQASPAFLGLGGPSSVGGDLDTWLPDKWEFVSFVQTKVNCIADGHVVPMTFGRLRVQPPIALQARLEYSAECALDLLWNPLEEVNEDDMCARVLLTNLSQRRSKKSSRKARSRTSGELSWKPCISL